MHTERLLRSPARDRAAGPAPAAPIHATRDAARVSAALLLSPGRKRGAAARLRCSLCLIPAARPLAPTGAAPCASTHYDAPRGGRVTRAPLDQLATFVS